MVAQLQHRARRGGGALAAGASSHPRKRACGNSHGNLAGGDGGAPTPSANHSWTPRPIRLGLTGSVCKPRSCLLAHPCFSRGPDRRVAPSPPTPRLRAEGNRERTAPRPLLLPASARPASGRDRPSAERGQNLPTSATVFPLPVALFSANGVRGRVRGGHEWFRRKESRCDGRRLGGPTALARFAPGPPRPRSGCGHACATDNSAD
jgi:hypothetical protein